MAVLAGEDGTATAAVGALQRGVVVEVVQRGFAAEVAGIRKGDVLTAWSQAGADGSERDAAGPPEELTAATFAVR